MLFNGNTNIRQSRVMRPFFDRLMYYQHSREFYPPKHLRINNGTLYICWVTSHLQVCLTFLFRRSRHLTVSQRVDNAGFREKWEIYSGLQTTDPLRKGTMLDNAWALFSLRSEERIFSVSSSHCFAFLGFRCGTMDFRISLFFILLSGLFYFFFSIWNFSV